MINFMILPINQPNSLINFLIQSTIYILSLQYFISYIYLFIHQQASSYITHHYKNIIKHYSNSNMNDLTQKLIPSIPQLKNQNSFLYEIKKQRMTYIYEKGRNDPDNSLDFEGWENEKKLYHSIIEQPEIGWNSQQIMERTLLFEEEEPEFQTGSPSKQIPKNQSIATMQSKLRSTAYNKKLDALNDVEKPKKKQLNNRIFNMDKGPQTCLYYFNLIFSFFFRVGLVILLIQLIVEGDGDSNKNQQMVFVSILLGLEGIVGLLYFLALTKMLYTKSSDISVYFQKQFYEKPYAEIHMQRILRKHFTVKKIVSNLCRLANPFTKFSNDIRISILRQQIYKRIELIIIFIPLTVMFIMGIPWFKKSNEIQFKFDVKLLLAIVVCMQACRATLHYIIIYIFS